MTDERGLRPWEELNALAKTRDAERLEAYIETLSAKEIAGALVHLTARQQIRVLETLTPDDAADLIDDLPLAQAADLVERLSPEVAGTILRELPSDDQADLVVEMEDEDARAILATLDRAEARGIIELARYAPDVAGGLMVTEVTVVRSTATVGAVVEGLRRQAGKSDFAIQYVYVVDPSDRLVGVLRIRDLLFSRDDVVIESIMIPDPVTVHVEASLDELADLFERRAFLGLPVVDDAGRLVGLVTRASVLDALAGQAESDLLKTQGIVGGEELRTMPLLQRSRRRLSWLSINIVLNIIAASVIALFEDTLSAVIALAFFLPIISDMSGCSGNQAVAVSIRELSLGLVKPFETLYVWLKEIGIGILNGLVLGTLIGVVAWLWRGNPFLGVVVGLALAANTMIAVSIGGAIPLILKRMKMDPALASGPVLTTVTDICGFFLVLGIATLMLPRLVG